MVLHRLLAHRDYEVAGLVTTFLGDDQMVNLHFIPERLIRQQAEALGLPLFTLFLPEKPINAIYEQAHQNKFQELLKEEDIRHIAFGDLFLEPIKAFRDQMMAPTGLTPLYPLWGTSTLDLLREVDSLGIRALVCAVDRLKLPTELLGQQLSYDLIAPFAPGVDWCGENGEFHTLVYDGPIFKQAVSFAVEATYGQVDYRPEIDMAMEYLQWKTTEV